MVTTIQVSNELKEQLAQEKKGKTYEQFLTELLKDKKRMELREQIKEYCSKYAYEDLAEVKEWETSEVEWN